MKLGQNHTINRQRGCKGRSYCTRGCGKIRAIIMILPIQISCLKLLHHLINTMLSAMTAASITPG